MFNTLTQEDKTIRHNLRQKYYLTQTLHKLEHCELEVIDIFWSLNFHFFFECFHAASWHTTKCFHAAVSTFARLWRAAAFLAVILFRARVFYSTRFSWCWCWCWWCWCSFAVVDRFWTSVTLFIVRTAFTIKLWTMQVKIRFAFAAAAYIVTLRTAVFVISKANCLICTAGACALERRTLVVVRARLTWRFFPTCT